MWNDKREAWRRQWHPTPVFLPEESQGRGAWWASIYGVAQSRTQLKRLSSSSRYVSYLYHRPLWSWLHKYKCLCCIIQPSSTSLALVGGYCTTEPHVKLLKIVCIITKKYFIAKKINIIWSFSKSWPICYWGVLDYILIAADWSQWWGGCSNFLK